MTTVDTIAQAIKEKKALEFAYHGFDRVVVPYACGLTPTNEIKMIGFQIGGGTVEIMVHISGRGILKEYAKAAEDPDYLWTI